MNLNDIGRVVGGVVDGAVDVARTAVERGAEVVQQAVETVAEPIRDGFDAAGRAVNDLLSGGGDDIRHDGHLTDVNGKTYPPGTPLSEIEPKGTGPTVIEVNGVGTSVAGQQGSLQAVQQRTGARVIGLHNATEGHIKDLVQATLDRMDKGHNAAVDSLADTVYAELQAGRDVHLMGHSQGAIIVSRAVGAVKRRMMAEDGMTLEQAEAALGKVKVETFGGAAPSYPDGPQYVHYCNRLDPAVTLMGLGSTGLPPIPGTIGEHPPGAGRDAVIRWFDTMVWQSPLDNHDLDTTYLDQRVPFDQARRGDFTPHPDPAL